MLCCAGSWFVPSCTARWWVFSYGVRSCGGVLYYAAPRCGLCCVVLHQVMVYFVQCRTALCSCIKLCCTASCRVCSGMLYIPSTCVRCAMLSRAMVCLCFAVPGHDGCYLTLYRGMVCYVMLYRAVVCVVLCCTATQCVFCYAVPHCVAPRIETRGGVQWLVVVDWWLGSWLIG